MYVLTVADGLAGAPRRIGRYSAAPIARNVETGGARGNASGLAMHRHSRRGAIALAGLGATPTQVVGMVGSFGGPVVTAAAAPAVAAALGISASLAFPIVGAAFAGLLFGVNALLNSGCGPACVQTSEWANQAEPLLQANIAKYFSLSPRTAADRQSALNIFDAVWAGLVERCSQPGLSTAGRNCIGDRRAGACKWPAASDSPYPGGPRKGACFNWFAGYRDPIANDTNVVSEGAALLSSLTATSSGGVAVWPLVAIAGLIAAGVLL